MFLSHAHYPIVHLRSSEVSKQCFGTVIFFVSYVLNKHKVTSLSLIIVTLCYRTPPPPKKKKIAETLCYLCRGMLPRANWLGLVVQGKNIGQRGCGADPAIS